MSAFLPMLVPIVLWLIETFILDVNKKRDAKTRFMQWIEARSAWHRGPADARDSEQKQIDELENHKPSGVPRE